MIGQNGFGAELFEHTLQSSSYFVERFIPCDWCELAVSLFANSALRSLQPIWMMLARWVVCHLHASEPAGDRMSLLAFQLD